MKSRLFLAALSLATVWLALCAETTALADVAPELPNVASDRTLEVTVPDAPEGKAFFAYPVDNSGGPPMPEVVRLEGTQLLHFSNRASAPSIYLADADYAGDGTDLETVAEQIGRAVLPPAERPIWVVPLGQPNLYLEPVPNGFRLRGTMRQLNLFFLGFLIVPFLFFLRSRLARKASS